MFSQLFLFSFIIELVVAAGLTIASQKYSIQKDSSINDSLNSSSVIERWEVNSKLNCLMKCNLLTNCYSVTYNMDSNSTNNCVSYSKIFLTNELISSKNTNLYFKECTPARTLNDTNCINRLFNFVDLFQLNNLQKNITNYNGKGLSSVISFLAVNSTYYVFQYAGKNALVYNEFWEYQNTVPLGKSPRSAFYEKDEIFMTSNIQINKYNKYLNLTIQSIQTGIYEGMFFNSTTGLIYLADKTNKKIDIFNQSLSLVGSLKTTFVPWFITEYNGMLAISENSATGNINFFQNNVLVKTIVTLCNCRVISMLFDDFDHMIVLCNEIGKLLVYNTDGTFTGINKRVCYGNGQATYISFDSKGRIIITCNDHISIFY